MWIPSSTPFCVRSLPNRPYLAAVSAVTAILLAPAAASAQQLVFDPRNHLENALQAARQLESLANEARSLAASPYSHLSQSSQALRDMGELARAAKGLAATADEVERQFDTLYSADVTSSSLLDLVANAQARTQTARRTAEDLARSAAVLERQGDERSARVIGALEASQSAPGQTAAIQSTNQLLAVVAEDLAALRAATLAQSRLSAEQAARNVGDQAGGEAARAIRWRGEATAPTPPAFDPFGRARQGRTP